MMTEAYLFAQKRVLTLQLSTKIQVLKHVSKKSYNPNCKARNPVATRLYYSDKLMKMKSLERILKILDRILILRLARR